MVDPTKPECPPYLQNGLPKPGHRNGFGKANDLSHGHMLSPPKGCVRKAPHENAAVELRPWRWRPLLERDGRLQQQLYNQIYNKYV